MGLLPATTFDPEDWTLREPETFAPNNCRVFEARTPSRFSKLAWSSCGAGCEVAEVTQGLSDVVVSSAASTRHGSAYSYFSHPLAQAPGHGWISRLVRLRDGVTTSALGVDFVGPVCTDSIGGQTALAQFHDAGPAGADKKLFGIAAEPPDHFVWAAPAEAAAAIPEGLVQIATDDRIFTLGKGGVFALHPPDNHWEVIERPSSSLYGAGSGDLAAWIESDSTRVRGWKPDGRGARTLTDAPPGKTCALAVSDQQVVGVASDGCLGASVGIRFWSLARTGAEPETRVSRKLGGSVYITSPNSVRTWGDYAAVQVWSEDSTGSPAAPPYFVVVELSSWKAWKVSSIGPYFMEESMWTLDDTYLYWGENKDPVVESLRVRRVARVRLDSMDVVANRL